MLYKCIINKPLFFYPRMEMEVELVGPFPSDHSINKAFSSTGLLHAGCFSFFTPFKLCAFVK